MEKRQGPSSTYDRAEAEAQGLGEPLLPKEGFIRKNLGSLVVTLLAALLINAAVTYRDRILSDERNRLVAESVKLLEIQMRDVQDFHLKGGQYTEADADEKDREYEKRFHLIEKTISKIEYLVEKRK